MKSFYLIFALFSAVCWAGLPVSRTCKITSLTESALVGPSSSVQIVDEDQSRSCIIIVNKGSQIVYITVASGGGATEGVPIPSGGNWEPQTPFVNAVYARSASGTQTVLVVEGK